MPDQLETLIQQVTLQQLQSSLVLQRLKMKPLEGQTTLRQRTIHAYKAHVLTALDEILSTEGQKPAVLLARLQRFLADNWRLIKGSMLSYTALPTDEITELLCDVANIVAQQSAEAAAINLLMPDIVTDSAGEVMPDGSRFVDLDQCDIKQVLKTHIELFEGKYLCPVAMLLQTYPINAIQQPIANNPYWDTASYGDAELRLKEPQLSRLTEHSDSAKAYVSLHQQRKRLLSENNSLYERLVSLTESMYMNSVNAMGSEHNAGKNFYTEFRAFTEFYDGLKLKVVADDDLELKNPSQIPKSLDDEIGHLKKMMADRYTKHEAIQTSSDDICLASRHRSFQPAVERHKTHLQCIGLAEEQKRKLLESCEHELRVAHDNLTGELAHNKYQGSDSSLGLSLELIEVLQIDFKIDDFDDVEQLASVPQQDMQILLGDPARRKDIINAIWSMNNLVMLMHHLSAEKIKILFANMADQIYKRFLKEDNDQYQKYHTEMLALLTSLPDEKAKIILDTYHLRMMQAIKSFDDFESMNNLRPTHFVYFSRNLRKEQMEAWELDFLALKYYRHYQGETRENFFTAIKEKIVDDIIRNPYRMTSIKDLLDERHWLQCTSLILKDPRCIIKTKYDFNRLYEKLNATQRQELIQRSGELFAEFLTDIHDYCDLYNTLDIDDRDLFFEVSGGIRQAYSLSYRDFSDTYSKLNDSHKEIFFTEREQSGFKEIDDEHFIDTYNGLSNEHKLRFFDKRHDAILDGELDTFEFKRVYTTLLAQHQKMYVDHVMIKLVDQIGKTDTTELKAMVERVYKATQGEHKSLIFEKVFIPFLEHLISLSNVHLQLDSCIRICKSLEPQHQDKFFDGFKHMLPSIIDSYNFAEYHKKLEARHRPFLTAEYANQYARTLATSSDFFNRSYDALDNDEERRILVDKMLAAPVGDKGKFYLESEYTWNILYAKLNEDGKTQLLESTLTHRVQKVYGRVQYERMLDRLQAADKPRFIDAVQKDILNMKRIYDALIESTRSLRASFPASHLFAEDIEPAKFIDRFFKYLESKPESLLAKAWKLYSNNVKYLAREVGEPNPELQEKLEAAAEKNSWFASSAGFWGNKALQPDKEGAETSRHSRMLDRLNNPSRK